MLCPSILALWIDKIKLRHTPPSTTTHTPKRSLGRIQDFVSSKVSNHWAGPWIKSVTPFWSHFCLLTEEAPLRGVLCFPCPALLCPTQPCLTLPSSVLPSHPSTPLCFQLLGIVQANFYWWLVICWLLLLIFFFVVLFLWKLRSVLWH